MLILDNIILKNFHKNHLIGNDCNYYHLIMEIYNQMISFLTIFHLIFYNHEIFLYFIYINMQLKMIILIK